MAETEINKKPQLERQKSKDLHVNFIDLPEIKDEKKKYLTAKYGANEINLIRKRLEIENWLSDRLNELFKRSDESIEIDIDQIVLIEKEEDKKSFLMEKLNKEKNQQPEIDEFIKCFIEKLKSY